MVNVLQYLCQIWQKNAYFCPAETFGISGVHVAAVRQDVIQGYRKPQSGSAAFFSRKKGGEYIPDDGGGKSGAVVLKIYAYVTVFIFVGRYRPGFFPYDPPVVWTGMLSFYKYIDECLPYKVFVYFEGRILPRLFVYQYIFFFYGIRRIYYRLVY